MEAVDPYQVLGVDAGCSQDDITAAYRSLSQLVHPDRTVGLPPTQRDAATEQMVRLNQAHALIGTPQARSRFDASRARTPRATPPAGPPTAPPPMGRHRAPVLGALAIISLLMIGALTIYQVGRSRPAATVPTTAVQETFTIEPFTVVTLPDPPSSAPAITDLPTSAAPVEIPETIGAAPATSLGLVPIEPLRPTSTVPPSTAPATLLATEAPGCWFVQVASTPDPNIGVEWARPAVMIESPLLPMYFVSFQEWPEGLPTGTVLAGTVAISERDAVALLDQVRQAGVAGAFVRPMPARVCRSLVPFS